MELPPSKKITKVMDLAGILFVEFLGCLLQGWDGNPGWMGWDGIFAAWPGGVDDLRLGPQWAFYFPGLCGQPGSKESLGWGSFSIGG